jgi:hypothetical protein
MKSQNYRKGKLVCKIQNELQNLNESHWRTLIFLEGEHGRKTGHGQWEMIGEGNWKYTYEHK